VKRRETSRRALQTSRYSSSFGRIAQLVRAAGLQPAGRGFESLCAHLLRPRRQGEARTPGRNPRAAGRAQAGAAGPPGRGARGRGRREGFGGGARGGGLEVWVSQSGTPWGYPHSDCRDGVTGHGGTTCQGYGKHSLREPLLALSVGHDLAINQNGERSRAKSAEPALPLRPDFDQMFANFLIPCALR
jgi:hypothetical protein